MRAKHVLCIVCVLTLVAANIAFAVTSSETIALFETGAHGADKVFDGTTKVYGAQYADATNKLYVGIQERGHYELGGVVYSIAVPAGGTANSRHSLSNDKYHVILDPSGPMANGCHGSGKIYQ